MRKIPITANYVSGFLERRGCFTLLTANHTIGFRLIDEETPEHTEAVCEFLRNEYKIHYRRYNNNAFTIASYKDTVKLIEFMRRYCYRNDYLIGRKFEPVKAIYQHYDKKFKTHLIKGILQDKQSLDGEEQKTPNDSSSIASLPSLPPVW